MPDTYLEYDYLPEKKKRRRALRKRPRWPFLLLGFLIGFVTLPAIIVIVTFFFVNRPVEKTVNTIDKVTNANLYETLFGNEDELGYLDGRYGDMSLLDAFKDIIAIAEKGGDLTFDDLSTISPQVENSVDKLVNAAYEKNIILDKAEVMATPLNQFSDLLMDEAKEIKLGEVLLAVNSEIFEDESTGAILKNLFFGKMGVNYTIDTEGKIQMLPLTYTYDDVNDVFVCVDKTPFLADGDVWTAEDGTYISPLNGEYAVYSASGDLLYQLQSKIEKSYSVYTAVTVNSDGIIEMVKQQSLALGAFMGKDSNPMDIIGKLELGVLLGITTREQAEQDSNAMLVALAYGSYGTDFEYDDSGNIIPIGMAEFTTLGDLMSSPDEVLNSIQLGALLGITTRTDAEADGNAMLVALAYGTYGVDFAYDESDNIVPIGDKEFTTLGDLMSSPDEVLNGIRLGSLLGITTKTDAEKEGNEMLVALAYGTYGTDFEYDESNNIVPIGDKEFTTLGDLINNPDEVLNGIRLGSLLGITTRTDAEKEGNEMLVALAYGTYGTDFAYDESDNIVAIKDGKPFTTLGDLINNSDEVLNGIQLGALFGIKTKADVESGDNDMMVAIAFGTYGVDFAYDESDNIVPIGDKKFTTLGDLLNSPDEVLQTVQIGTLLGIKTKADVEASDSLMISLAFGTYGVDFEYDESDNIVAIEDGKPFTTVAALMDADEVSTILEDIPLSSIFTVDVFDKDADPLTLSLIYGTNGKHYILDYTTNSIVWQLNTETEDPDDYYKERTFGDLRDGDLTDIVNEFRVGDMFEITTESPKLLTAIQDWYIADLTNPDKINGLYLKDVINIDENDKFLSAIGDWTIADLTEENVKKIELSNVLDVKEGETGMLATLVGKGWTIDKLTEENIQNLTLGEVLPTSISGDSDVDFFAALENTPIKDLNATYIKENLTIGQVLGIKDTDDGILATFADYKVGDFTEDALKNELTIGDVVNVSAHPILMALENTTLSEVDNDAIQNALNGLTLAEVVTIDHPLFNHMSNKKLGEINAEYIDSIKVSDALGLESVSEENDPILYQIKDLTLGYLKNGDTLKNKITSLKLKQLMDVENVPVLELLGDYALNEIDKDVIDGLKICDVIEGAEDNFVLKHLSDSTIATLADDMQNITVIDFFEDAVYQKATDTTPAANKDEQGFLLDDEGKRIMVGTWKYLLTYNPDKGHEVAYTAPEDYKVTDMELLIENMHNNIEVATLHDLHDDGIIPHLGDTNDDGEADSLDTPLIPEGSILLDNDSFAEDLKKALGLDSTLTLADLKAMDVGDLTILQASNYLTLLLNNLT